MSKSYDMIASLGGNCSAAMQLKNRGLRREAYPFDWVYMESEKSIWYLIEAFGNGFKDFALEKNLVPLYDGPTTGVARYSYKDVLTGFCFVHHFNEKLVTTDAYERQMNPFRRRLARFLERIDMARDILFILTVRFPVGIATLKKLALVLNKLYPEKNIDLHVKEFNAKLSSPLSLVESWPLECGFSGGERHAYDAFPYSFEYASREWAFLDDIKLNGFVKPPMRGWARAVYKLWKKSGKWLNGNGYGVLGVKF